MKLLLASVLLLGACSDKASFEQVPVVGLPCAAAGQQLVHKIVMEATRDGGTLRMTHSGGWSDGRAVTAELPKDAETKLVVRFGVCPDAPCRYPRWIENTQTVSVDTRLDDAKLVVGVPGDHACR